MCACRKLRRATLDGTGMDARPYTFINGVPATINPKNQNQESRYCNEIQACGQPGKEVQPQRTRPNQQCVATPRSQPFVLKTKSSQGEQADVVVLHHVLRIVQVSSA